ncbi:MAG: NTP transferase domain-containing protein [Lachnospiraceae bacterium]|jgi:spore coat polysaccharide biosynthesis protein SpsF|nr:NTP transferase domain-containing protein [Lachnospiraceae bacterium]
MKFLAIIQARCGSSRLPSKVLKDLCGKTILERVIERVRKSKYVDEVVVATTLNEDDIPIVSLVSSLGIRVFAGNSLDVLDRYYQAAKIIQPEYVIRITADCPVFDAKLLDDAIEKLKPETDYMAACSETLADGLDLEIIRYEVLKQVWKEAHLASEREHVTMYIKNNKKLFTIQDYKSPLGNLHNERWTVDEPEDYFFIKNIYDHFKIAGKEAFDSKDILAYLNANPKVREINKGFIRNEGLLISLKNDRTVKRPIEE